MKFTVLLLSLLFSISAFAEWSYLGETEELAQNYDDYVGLQHKYSWMWLPALSPEVFASALVSGNHYKWIGRTKCPANDKRLTRSGYFSKVCDNKERCATAFYDIALPEKDPCLE